MTVLRRGYVPVEPTTDGFDDKLREQLRKQDPGGKAGKQIGGQLNRALKRLDLAPVDVKADPRAAYASIKETEARLQRLARESPTVEVKIQTERAIAQLSRFKKQLGDIAEDEGVPAAQGFFARFSARLGPLMASTPLSPHLAAAAGVAAVAAAPVVASTIAGAVIGGAGIGGITGGLLLASRNEQVKEASRSLGQYLMADLERRASGFVQPLLGALGQVRAGYLELRPDIDRIFDNSARLVAPLTDGLLKGARGFLSGFADAVEEADPVVESIRTLVAETGTSLGDMFRTLSQDADEGASAIDDVTFAITSLVSATTGILHAGATVKGWTAEVDKAVDRTRYWIEDNSALNDQLAGLGFQLDITADGFAHGTAEAEAYRAATLGTATAADFATLKRAGMTDADIAAADASGKYRAELERVRAETIASAAANGTLIATTDDVKNKSDAAALAQREYTRALDSMGTGAGKAAQFVEGLRKATTNLYGAQIAGVEANEGYQASWDALSEAVKKNKGSLDIHTAAGRANRDALQELLTKSNEMYFADIAAGTAVDDARKKHEKRTGAIRREAGQLGLNKKATNDLIGTYGRIPPKRETDLVLDGVNKVVNSLMDLYVYQRSLAEGVPIGSIRAILNKEKGPAKRYGGYHEGGWTGPGAKMQPAGVVHADEYVIRKESRAKLERTNPGLLDEMNATGQMPGYAGGGFVGAGPVETRTRMPYEVDLTKLKIPSRDQVAAKVVGVFNREWPSSPAAQRGDSGVWRKVVALIKSTGPLSGSFGNSYRPGDPKWHGSGRAVDWMGYNQDALATFLARQRPLELIHRTRQRDYAYTRGRNKGSFNNALMEAHRNHIHIAMANGGIIGEPVAGVGLRSGNSYSFGERGPETVTPGVGGGDTYVFHFHDSVITKEQHAEDLVVSAITRAKRNRRLP